MEPLAFARRVVAWRWTPCVAPVMGSVMIALLTLLVVPEEIGGSGAGAGPLALRGKRAETPGAASDASRSGANLDGATPGHPRGVGNGRPRRAADPVQGFLHEPEGLPIEAVEPTLQPEPPPLSDDPEPGTLPPPDVPLPPLGPDATPPSATAPDEP